MPWKPACWLRAHGPDAATFLQSQFSNDLRLLDRQPAVYGLWLSAKGKVIGDSFVLGTGEPDAFWVGSYASPASVVQGQLESHLIADDVTLEDHTSDWIGFSVFGEPASALLAEPAATGFIFSGRRARAVQAEWVLPRTAAAVAQGRLQGVPELAPAFVERIRINDGVPAVPADIGPGDLPNEGGLEVDAVSYSKGCYVGQEVMARLKAMGQVRRRLLRVRGRGPVPPLPAALFAGGRQVGELRSAAPGDDAGFIGLAMVSRINVAAETELAWSAGSAPNVALIDSP